MVQGACVGLSDTKFVARMEFRSKNFIFVFHTKVYFLNIQSAYIIVLFENVHPTRIV